MLSWPALRVLCLGGAGQVGRETCRQLAAKGTGTVFVHDLTLARAREAVAELGAAHSGTRFVASGGNLFDPAGLGTWELRGDPERTCRDVPRDEDDAARLLVLLDAHLGAFTPDVVRTSLLWNLAEAYRPHVVVDTINTATVLGYRGDLIQSARTLAAPGRRVLETLRRTGGPLRLDELEGRLAALPRDLAEEVSGGLAEVLRASLRMTAFLDAAAMIRFVQCLHALFHGDTAVPGFRRYVKVHTTGLGGMGFNIRYTHGDTGEPGLSTKLLGKVCATGSLTQLVLTLSHTPGCDVRVVVPATLIGWVEPRDLVIHGELPRWGPGPGPATVERGPLPLVDSRELVPCDGSVSLGQALREAPARVTGTGEVLEVPYLSSGENEPYAAEDIAAVTSLGQMGCITKEEVARAALECLTGDSRYDLLAAIDAASLLPTQTAAAVRDRVLQACRARRRRSDGFRTPSISLGNLGPTTAKLLFEIEIIRATWGTVERVAREADEMEMTLRACSYVLDDGEGALLRRQVLSLGLPVFLRKGPGEAGLLVGSRLLLPDPRDAAALDARLDPGDPAFRDWLAKGWIDLTGPRMRWWRDRFTEVHDGLRAERAVSRGWFDPAGPFTAGQLLAYHYSITGGGRKQYM